MDSTLLIFRPGEQTRLADALRNVRDGKWRIVKTLNPIMHDGTHEVHLYVVDARTGGPSTEMHDGQMTTTLVAAWPAA